MLTDYGGITRPPSVCYALQAMSPSDHDDQNDPDGPFAFKRRKFCQYYEVGASESELLCLILLVNYVVFFAASFCVFVEN